MVEPWTRRGRPTSSVRLEASSEDRPGGQPYIPPGCPWRLKVCGVRAVDNPMSDVEPVIAAIAEDWPPFGLTEQPLPSGLVLAVSGELDLATAPDLRERLGTATTAA